MKIFFDHLQKTGGTTLNQLFARNLGEESVTPVNLADRYSTVMRRYAGFAAIAGHVEFLPGDSLPEGRVCMTLLRDPVERCLSWYSYNRHDVAPFPGQRGEVVALCRSMSLLECLRSDSPLLASSLREYQASHFARMEWDGSTATTAGEKLAIARRVLERYDLVGVQEEFDDFVDLVCARLGWPPVEIHERLKASSRRLRREDLDRETLDALLAANAADVELHAYARELHATARRREFRRLLSASRAAPLRESAAAAAPVERESVPLREFGNRKVRIVRGEVYGHVSRTTDPMCGGTTSITLVLEAEQDVDDLTVGIQIEDLAGELMYGDNTRLHGYTLSMKAGTRARVDFTFRMDLAEGAYSYGGSAHRGASHLEECFHWVQRLGTFNVAGVLGNFFEGRVHLQPQLAFGTTQGHALGVARIASHAQIVPVLRDVRLEDFRATLRLVDLPTALPRRALTTLAVEVRNDGVEAWPSSGERPVRLSYHWIDERGEMRVLDGERTHLPFDVPPGDTVRLSAIVRAPEETGHYALAFDLVQEGVAWFEGKGREPARVDVTVE